MQVDGAPARASEQVKVQSSVEACSGQGIRCRWRSPAQTMLQQGRRTNTTMAARGF
ncbi:MAG TPA: hypothetical protein VFI25_09765 [Planctomycetota bacterium]|nr:hypothetical protein [Planctomycetota bacterium]